MSLGEVMLRLDPGDKRIHTTRSFEVWEGGGEYNVARGLKRCFGLDAAVVTALADNPVGKLVQDLIYQGGVDQSHVKWVKYDGVGRTVRNGMNFTERGFAYFAGKMLASDSSTASFHHSQNVCQAHRCRITRRRHRERSVSRSAVDGPFRRFAGQESIDQPGSE